MIDSTPALIEAVATADSAKALLAAVEALAARQDPLAIPTLIAVLGYNNPGAAVAAVEGLVALGEPVIPQLLEQIDTYNYGARAWAVRVFARIGDPCALDLLIDSALNDFSQSVRRAAAKGLGNILWHKLPQTEVASTQERVFTTLVQILSDGEWVVRYAAIVGLESLALTSEYLVPKVIVQLETMAATESDSTLRARIALALQKVVNHIKFGERGRGEG
ncbi:HEAT repeat domain-containing protein [Gloeocapsa sp. PCC 73106]|uniref:HEAT repeat domain-containing protein n=1 Tax=Gloeocapsa sp. PCC 73106 TaxID=102232 RepID=UPI0002ACA66E|nr:HEAT repeat domain-containing protein [Gloeocapsa sp. PCC 73106]ELR97463.1 hypothetical protein GLO73106DRAFT_00012730 [Gloeocapsa sp. PCC 73106]